MASNHKVRLVKLEQKRRPRATNVSQVVIYNPNTGEPLHPLDPSATRYIWIADDGRGLVRDWR